MTMKALDFTSTRPYLVRALHEWCTENGLTPYLAVLVDDSVQVPREYVKDGEIVLNVSLDATGGLKLGNDFIEFKTRFAGVARQIVVPVSRVIAIYARENGQGMTFPVAVVQDPVGHPAAGGDASSVRPEGGVSSSAVSSKPVQLVPVEQPSQEGAGDGDGTPPKPPAGTRPALKRIK